MAWPAQDEPWFAAHLDALSAAYFSATPPPQAAADLRMLHDLGWSRGRDGRNSAAGRESPRLSQGTIPAGDGGSSMHDCHVGRRSLPASSTGLPAG